MPRRKRQRPRRTRHDDSLQVLRGPKAKGYPLLHVDRPGDVGFNLTSVEDVTIEPGTHLPPTEIPVDLRVKLPRGTAAAIWPRSSTHSRYPTLILCQAPIDNGYTGPIGPRFRNIGAEPVTVPQGTAIAQLVITPAVVPPVIEVDELPETERGSKRYGSTGK